MMDGQLPPKCVLARRVRRIGRDYSCVLCSKRCVLAVDARTRRSVLALHKQNLTGWTPLCELLLTFARLIQGGDPRRKESEGEYMDVEDAVNDLMDTIKTYQSKSKVCKVLIMSKMFRRRQEEAEAVVDRAIWRLNVSPPMSYAFLMIIPI